MEQRSLVGYSIIARWSCAAFSSAPHFLFCSVPLFLFESEKWGEEGVAAGGILLGKEGAAFGVVMQNGEGFGITAR